MLSDYKEIIFGISEKKDGPMKLANNRGQAVENRQNFFSQQGIDNGKIVSAALANGLEVKIVYQNDQGKMIGGVDALITNQKDLILAITVADCAPIYFYDPVKKVIALVHAGWRGVLGNIIAKTISVMKDSFSSDSKDLQVFVGPHIRACHFEVKDDVAEMFVGYQKFVVYQKEKIFIDLKGIIQEQLLAGGVSNENIIFNPSCTYCEEKTYFSWRRDKPEIIEAMVAYLGLF